LQIAVIIFAMLTIILAITTYIFYAQSQTATVCSIACLR
jgi:hypothetical protein